MDVKKVRRIVLAVMVVAAAGLIFFPATASVAKKTTKASFRMYKQSEHRYAEYSGNCARQPESYLEPLSGGKCMRVQGFVAYGGKPYFIVEYYSKSKKLLSHKKIKLPLPVWGAFYSDGKNYWIVSGKSNPKESNRAECYRVTRYNRSWKETGHTSFKGCMTVEPFKGGSCSVTMVGETLYVSTCRLLYADLAGINHQSNIRLAVDTKTMKGYKWSGIAYPGYVSHSFNQFARTDVGTGRLVTLDHGDAYPRAVVIYELEFANQKRKLEILKIAGKYGQNTTGVDVGDFQVGDGAFFTAMLSVDQKKAKKKKSLLHSGTRNIYLAVSKKGSKKVSLKKLTKYKKRQRDLQDPYLVRVSANRIVLMWANGKKLSYREYDGNGKPVGKLYHRKAELSDCHPVVVNRKICWYKQKGKKITFYEIPLSSMKKVSVGKTALKSVKSVSDGVELTWSRASGADGYRIYRKVESEKNWKVIANLDGQFHFLDKNVRSGTKYTYTVRAFRLSKKDKMGAYDKNGKSIIFLRSPEIIWSSYSKEGPVLHWKRYPEADGYVLYKGEKENRIKSNFKLLKTFTSGDVTSFIDKTRTGGTMYSLAIVNRGTVGPHDTLGWGHSWAETPEIESITNENDKLSIKVTRDFHYLGNRSVKLERKAGNGKWEPCNGDVVEEYGDSFIIEDKTVESGTTYTYRAYIGLGEINTDFSNEKSIHFLKGTKVNGTEIKRDGLLLKWTPVKGAEGYKIFRLDAWNGTWNVGNGWTLIDTISSGDVDSYFDKTLVKGGIFHYAVQSYAGEADGYCDWVENYIPYAIYTEVTEIERTEKGFRINYVPKEGIMTYCLYRRAGDGEFQEIRQMNTRNPGSDNYEGVFTDEEGLESGTVYEYKVCTKVNDACSVIADKGVKMQYLSMPYIRDVKQNENDREVTVSWKKSPGAKGYRIYRKNFEKDRAGDSSADSGSDNSDVDKDGYALVDEVLGENTLSYVDTTWPSGTAYRYRVYAFSESGVSYPSESTVDIPDYWKEGDLFFLPAPRLLGVETTEKGFVFRWEPVGGAERYHVYTKIGDGDWKYAGGGSDDCSYTYKLQYGVKVSFTVSAYARCQTREIESGRDPNGLSAFKAVNDEEIKISSVKRDDYHDDILHVNISVPDGFDGYILYRKEKGGEYREIARDERVYYHGIVNYRDEDVEVGKLYSYKVKFTSEYYTSEMSRDEVSCMPFGTTDVTAAAYIGNNTISVDWNSVSYADGYILYRDAGKENIRVARVDGNVTHFDDKHLDKPGEYRYYVGICVGDEQAKSHGESAVAEVDRLEPAWVRAGTHYEGMCVSWNKGATPYADKYIIYVRKGNEEEWRKIAEADGDTDFFIDKNVEPREDYIYAVAACEGEVEYEKIRTGYSRKYTESVKITSLEKTPEGISISWTPMNDVTYYTVFRAKKGDNTTAGMKCFPGIKNATSFVDTTAEEGVEYYYSVAQYWKSPNSYETNGSCATSTSEACEQAIEMGYGDWVQLIRA